MKQIEPVFLHDFKDKTALDIRVEFAGTRWDYEAKDELQKKIENEKLMDGINIIFATYTDENYSGEAWVLFEKEGKLFETSGSHCSCYGLEGMWEPTEVSIEELELRATPGGTFGQDKYGSGDYRDQFIEMVGKLKEALQ